MLLQNDASSLFFCRRLTLIFTRILLIWGWICLEMRICLEIVYSKNQFSAKYWHHPCAHLVLVRFMGVFISLLVPCLNWEFKSDFIPCKSQQLPYVFIKTSINFLNKYSSLTIRPVYRNTFRSIKLVSYTPLSVQLVPSPLGSTLVNLCIQSRFLVPHLSQVSLVELVETIQSSITKLCNEWNAPPFKWIN